MDVVLIIIIGLVVINTGITLNYYYIDGATYAEAGKILSDLDAEGYSCKEILEKWDALRAIDIKVAQYVASDNGVFRGVLSPEEIPDDLHLLIFDRLMATHDLRRALSEAGFTNEEINRIANKAFFGGVPFPTIRNMVMRDRIQLACGYEEEVIPDVYHLIDIARVFKNEVVPRVYPKGSITVNLDKENSSSIDNETIELYNETIDLMKECTNDGPDVGESFIKNIMETEPVSIINYFPSSLYSCMFSLCISFFINCWNCWPILKVRITYNIQTFYNYLIETKLCKLVKKRSISYYNRSNK